MLLLLSNNINKHYPWMLSSEIFWSACAAAAITGKSDADRQYRRQHPKTFSKNIITLHNSVQVNVKFCVQFFFFYIFDFLYMLKTNGTELIDESGNVCLHFSGHVTSPAHTYFSPFTLPSSTTLCL